MVQYWLRKPKATVFTPLLLALGLAIACGAAAEPTPTPPTAATTAAPGAGTLPTAIPQPTPTPTLAIQPKYGAVVPMQYVQAPGHWHVWECGSGQCIWQSAPLYNTLVEYNPETADQNDIRGDLAKGWELSKDGLTYTFHLLENARWHDGKPLTAEDVVFSLDSMVDPVQPRPRSGQIKPYYAPGNAKAIDLHTVEVTTRFPAVAFLPFLATDNMKILPKHHLQTGVDMKLAENQLGSGPFKLVEYKKDISMEYTRNPNYFKEGRPYFDGMKYFIITDHGSVIAAIKSGQVLMSATMVSNLNNAEALQLEKDMKGKGKVYFAGPVGHNALLINTKAEPFTDVRVRRALSLAIHRQSLVEIFSKGVDRIGSPLPSNSPFFITKEELKKLPSFRETPDGQKHPDDLAEARRLLAEAGFPSGFKTSIMAATAVELVDLAAVVADQLKRFLNIEASIEPMELNAAYARYEALDWKLGIHGAGPLVLDPDAIFPDSYLKEGNRNWSRWEHPRLEELFKLQTRELDQEKRRALLLEMADIIMKEDTPWVSLYWTMRSWYVDNRIKNFHMPSTLYIYGKHEDLWLEK